MMLGLGAASSGPSAEGRGWRHSGIAYLWPLALSPSRGKRAVAMKLDSSAKIWGPQARQSKSCLRSSAAWPLRNIGYEALPACRTRLTARTLEHAARPT
jgi:hypothetical protein